MGNGICACSDPIKKKLEADLAQSMNKKYKTPKQPKITNSTDEKDSEFESDNEDSHETEFEIETENKNEIANELSKRSVILTDDNKDCESESESESTESEMCESSDNKCTQNNLTQLCICSTDSEHISQLFDDNNCYNLSECTVLNIFHSDISVIERQSNLDRFSNIRHLEIFKPNINGQSCDMYTIINAILHKLSQNCKLSSFKFVLSVKHCYAKQQKRAKNRKLKRVLNIPSNIEWLTLSNIGCYVNIAKCERLIGLQLLANMRYEQMVWSASMITFAVFCDSSNVCDNEWSDKCKANELRIKFVCLLKENFLNLGIEYNASVYQNEDIQKHSFDRNETRKCIILKETELNSKELYSKIMGFRFQNESELKSEKIKECEQCVWIRQIGQIKRMCA